MHYYLIEITNVSGTYAKAIWDKASEDEARMSFHQTLASAMANPDVESCLCMVTDECGNEYPDMKEYWSRPGEQEV